MALKEKIRHMVSKKKRRFKEDGFDLDLSYISENIIAMGFPAENLEGVYRNHIDDVVRFMESRHKDHYRIYNLCRDRAYNTARFRDRVICFPLDDHHPPSLQLMKPFCEDVHQWLSQDPDNVAAVHCKAGKGRTGVMICAYLLFAGSFASPDEALSYYGERRTTDMNGVTIPSQRRYVDYFGRLLRERLEYRSVPMLLKTIHFEMIPTFEKGGTCAPYFVVRSHDKKLYRSPAYETTRGARCLSMDVSSDESVSIIDDVRIDFFHRPGRLQKREKMFHFWFNTFFVCPGAGSPPSPRNHNRIKPKQSDPEFGARSIVYRQLQHQPQSTISTPATVTAQCSTPNGTPELQGNGCTMSSIVGISGTGTGGGGGGGSTSRKDSTESSSTTTSSNIVPPSRPNRTYSSPQTGDSISNCHHVLTLAKHELDAAHKDKTCKRFPANFKVHIILQCADSSHCPLTNKPGSSSRHHHHHHEAQQQQQQPESSSKEFRGRQHEKLSEEATDDDEVTSTDTDDEDEEEEESDVCAVVVEQDEAAVASASVTGPPTLDESGRVLTSNFCALCRSSNETMEQTGLSAAAIGSSASCSSSKVYFDNNESSPRESRDSRPSPRGASGGGGSGPGTAGEESEDGGGGGGGQTAGASGSLLAAPTQKHRRSSSPR